MRAVQEWGEAILAEFPETRGDWEAVRWTVAKRVIGLPGDVVECRDGRVLRNGQPVDEPYLSADPQAARTDCRATTVPDGFLYLLGDHRAVSLDSRHDGVYREDAVQGRVLIRVWPSTQ